jgi:hypothetical protein
MCSNLRNKSYCIRNLEYSKEEYLKMMNTFNVNSFISISKHKSEFEDLIKGKIHKFANIVNSVNVSGDNIINSKNAHECFMVEGENIKYCWRTFNGIKDSYDISGGLKNELVYESSLAADDGYLTKFFSHSKGNKNSDLIHLCVNCSNIFGCVGLKNKKYCILNKQYTKEQYEELVPKIIKHMIDMPYADSKGNTYRYGEFFPSELSPFYYNESIAQEFFPFTKDESIGQGYKWKDREERNYNIDIKNEDVPDTILNIDESIISKVIECEHKGSCNEQCTKAFKITSQELLFYKRMNLPIPHLCSNCRHYERLKQRNPLKLWHRKCMKKGCENEFETSYAPGRSEIVYCESCYNKEIY